MHCICMCTFHTPDVEVFEDLGIKVVNLSCHIQDVSNTIRTWGGKHTNAIRLLVNKYHTIHTLETNIMITILCMCKLLQVVRDLPKFFELTEI